MGTIPLFISIWSILAGPGQRSQQLGWSNTPRWQLPEQPQIKCPHGWALPAKRRMLRRTRVQCQPAPSSHPEPLPSPSLQTHPAQKPQLVNSSLPTATELMAMDVRTCHAFLRHHDVAFTILSYSQAPEVEQPIRLKGAIAGVQFIIPWSKNMATDPHSIWDCRLAAAMVPLATWLADQRISEVHYFSSLRRGAMARSKPKSQHNKALALDILGFRSHHSHEPPSLATVEQHYPRKTLRSCSKNLLNHSTMSRLYLQFVCFAAEHQLIHTLLTPDYDRAHHNHLHLDLKAHQSVNSEPFVSFAR